MTKSHDRAAAALIARRRKPKGKPTASANGTKPASTATMPSTNEPDARRAVLAARSRAEPPKPTPCEMGKHPRASELVLPYLTLCRACGKRIR